MKLNISYSFVVLFLLFTVSVVIYSCDGNYSPDTRKGKGGISIGGSLAISGQAPNSILPCAINDLASAQVATNVLEGLTKIGANGKAMPLLAESFETDESGLIYKFSLRKGVVFHDDACFVGGRGKEMKSSDVKYSFELLCKNTPENVAFSSTFKYLVEGANDYFTGNATEVSGFVVVDDYTFLIKCFVKSETLPLILASSQTAIVPKESVERYGLKSTIGTGPFLLKVADGAIKLQRNYNYYLLDEMSNQLPYLDEVVITAYASKAEEIKNFFADKIDIVLHINQDEAKQIMEDKAKEFENGGKYMMESSSDPNASDLFTIRKSNIKGFKINSDGTVNWYLVSKTI